MGDWSLNGKVILITGGARGIGAATARELSRRGARPVLADLDAAALAHHGVDVATIHPTWIDTDMVREGEREQRAFQHFRNILRPPFPRTYPVQRVVRDIVSGFEHRRRRICSPWFVHAAHAGRALLTTGLLERDQRAAMPEMERLFREDAADRGAVGASVSSRVAAQL